MRAPNASWIVSLLLTPVAASLGGCAHVDATTRNEPVADYRLGSDDVVDVAVWKEPALSAAVPVRPDGKISLPMVGDIIAAGLTAPELGREVTARLKQFVPEPVVTVMVKEVRASRFFVLGEVTHPGAFPLAGALTVLEAVSVAGGPTEFARKSRVVVIRRPRPGAKNVERVAIDLDDVLSGRSEPLALRAGDTVYVP